MTDPIWLSPLSHDLPWSGREPLPEAPALWALWVGGWLVKCQHPALLAPQTPESRAAWAECGWVEVERPRVESGRTA